MQITLSLALEHRTKDHTYFLNQGRTITDYNSNSTTRVVLTNRGQYNITAVETTPTQRVISNYRSYFNSYMVFYILL